MTFRHIDSAVLSENVVKLQIFSSSHNFYVFGVNRNPDLLDKNFDCLLTVLAED